MTNFIRAKIFKKEPPATQSGKNNLGYWKLEPKVNIDSNVDSLMGWRGGGDVRQQISLKFSSLKDAESFANKNRIIIERIDTNKRSYKIKSYAENFK